MCTGTAKRVEQLLKERSRTNELLRRRSEAKEEARKTPTPPERLGLNGEHPSNGLSPVRDPSPAY